MPRTGRSLKKGTRGGRRQSRGTDNRKTGGEGMNVGRRRSSDKDGTRGRGRQSLSTDEVGTIRRRRQSRSKVSNTNTYKKPGPKSRRPRNSLPRNSLQLGGGDVFDDITNDNITNEGQFDSDSSIDDAVFVSKNEAKQTTERVKGYIQRAGFFDNVYVSHSLSLIAGTLLSAFGVLIYKYIVKRKMTGEQVIEKIGSILGAFIKQSGNSVAAQQTMQNAASKFAELMLGDGEVTKMMGFTGKHQADVINMFVNGYNMMYGKDKEKSLLTLQDPPKTLTAKIAKKTNAEPAKAGSDVNAESDTGAETVSSA